VLTLDVRGAAPEHTEHLRSIIGVQSVSVEENDGRQTIDVHTGYEQDLTAAVLARLHDVAVLNVTKREPTLEDAYVSLIAEAGG
jgi:ABC-2 type transport system ATP-binding protein